MPRVGQRGDRPRRAAEHPAGLAEGEHGRRSARACILAIGSLEGGGGGSVHACTSAQRGEEGTARHGGQGIESLCLLHLPPTVLCVSPSGAACAWSRPDGLDRRSEEPPYKMKQPRDRTAARLGMTTSGIGFENYSNHFASWSRERVRGSCGNRPCSSCLAYQPSIASSSLGVMPCFSAS